MKYRKKPVVIEAVQWTGLNTAEVAALLQIDDYDTERECRWGEDRQTNHDAVLYVIRDEPRSLAMRTVHGEIALARVYDWVIPEPVPGRAYPCKPDIFAASYDPMSEAEQELAEAAGIGLAHLRFRIRILQAELSQTVDGSYRHAVRTLVGLFHARAAGLQHLREIGKDDSKIALTDVIDAVEMHVQPNTLGAPDGYVPPAPPSPEQAAEIQAGVNELLKKAGQS